jgi:hypothetical protein
MGYILILITGILNLGYGVLGTTMYVSLCYQIVANMLEKNVRVVPISTYSKEAVS